MDNTWQMKCTSSWPTASSPLPPPSRNQADPSRANYFHPYVAQEASLMEHAVSQEPLVYSTLNLGSSGLSRPDLGSSFLSLLSGSKQSLPHELVQNVSSFVPSSSGSGVPGVRLSFHRHKTEGIGSGDEHSLRMDPHRVTVVHNNCKTSSCDGVGYTKAVFNHAQDFPPRQGNSDVASSTIPHIQILNKTTSEAKSALMGTSRVCCRNTSGDLLLSNLGFLGVRCLCHGFQMSVAKFCEHSGSFSVNPGEAVQLESGETIGQWRRMYFLKFGIRVPDDSSGWDWPNGMSACGGLGNSNFTALPISFKNSNTFQPLNSFGGVLSSRQPLSDSLSYKDFYSGEFSNKNIIHSAEQKNHLIGPNVSRSFVDCSNTVNTGRALVHTVVDSRGQKNSLVGSSGQKSLVAPSEDIIPGAWEISKHASDGDQQTGAYHQNVTDYINFISKGSRSFNLNQNLRNLKPFGMDSIDGRHVDLSREGLIMDSNVAPSNIELRLGQPSQQTVGLVGSVPIRSEPYNATCDPLKTQFYESCIQTVHPRITQQSQQNFHSVPSDSSTSSQKEKEIQLNHIHHSLGKIAAIDESKTEQLKGVVPTKNPQVSAFLSHFPTLEGLRSTHSQISLAEGSKYQQVLVRAVQDVDPHISTCDQGDKEKEIKLNHIHHSLGKIAAFDQTKTELLKGVGPTKNPQASAFLSHFPTLEGLRSTQSQITLAEGSKYQQVLVRTVQDVDPHISKCDQGDHIHHSLEKIAAIDQIKTEQLKGVGPTKNPQVSAFLSHFPTLEGRRPTQSQISLAEGSKYQQVLLRAVQDVDPHISKCDQGDNWRTRRVDELEGKLSTSGSCLSNHLEKSQGLRLLADDLSYISAQAGQFFQNKQVGESSQLAGSIDGHEKQPCYFQSSGDHLDCGFSRSTNCAPVMVGSGLASTANSGYLPTLPPSAFLDKNIIDACKDSLDENMKLLTFRNMAELSKQENPVTFQINPVQGNLFCSSEMELQKKVSREHPESSWKPQQGTLQTTITAPPEGASRQFQSCCNCRFTGSVEKLIGLGGLGCCSFSISTQGVSLCPNGINHVADGQLPMLRLGRAENNNMAGSIVFDHCNQTQSNLSAGNCNCVVHSKYLTRNCILPRMHIDASKEHEGKNLNRGITDREIALGHGESLLKKSIITKKDSSTSQWKDVPAKATGSMERQAGFIDQNHADGGQISEITRKGYDAITSEAEFLKEQQMSNACSGSSAPVLTEVSVEVNGISCTVDAGDHGSVQNLLVDEGSGTEKCYSDRSGKRIETLKAASSSALSNQFPLDLIEELKLRNSSIKAKKDRVEHFEQEEKAGNRKRKTKWKKLDASTPSVNNGPQIGGSHYSEYSLKADDGSKNCVLHSSGPSNVKRKRSALLPQKVFQKKSLHESEDYGCRYQENDCNSELRCDSRLLTTPRILSERRIRHGQTSDVKAKLEDYQSTLKICGKKQRLVVHGNLGIISNGKSSDGYVKPAKIVSLKSILKVAKRCTLVEHHLDPNFGPTKKSGMLSLERIEDSYNKLSLSQKVVNGVHEAVMGEPRKLSNASVKKTYGCETKGCFVEPLRSKKDISEGVHQCLNHVRISGESTVQMNPRVKEARKRSLNELTGKNSKAAKYFHLEGSDLASQPDSLFCEMAILKKPQQVENEKAKPCLPNSKKRTKSGPYKSELDVFCCVCGSANKDEDNRLLECSRCLIRVHQACYGVSKVPKGCWCCRPCRTNSKNIACVLCGYEGGAMTRALRSWSIVKSLLKAWKMDLLPEIGSLESCVNLSGGTSQLGSSDVRSTIRLITVEDSSVIPMERKLHGCSINSSIVSCNFQVHNTITSGILDPTITQWVHMVCGLWTPGTRCPNVDTMSAFDVSGALRVGKNVVCSMCHRPGGSCIECRIVNCSIHFHPWCAHQKGLLQSEVEGVDNEKVGFYGRCLLHATNNSLHTGNQTLHINAEMEDPAETESTCARTEGYKGRKTGEALRHNLDSESNDQSGCLVTQEQINAWLHINGQKLSSKVVLLKPIASDTEYDCRKEYSRYKQTKGWKHLVVYKSGIHALGLYTSKFIARGAMVVEYVGEIVGPRVADKRELEYQSGKKLQYKSACYFFRIDKEHIIDATRRGGIARFVNHSCLPNCVAKIISVRNEKKVVFFAERDINPGEEITYDYHFNHEDEGKKIPCLCKSKNCRRYLN
ncbi:uncharacterized protein [Aristolochia californica]|uniref:uncharacterized protein isoform X2 n=1 Tax=Aristolochia californica TaxID=171875 RepID=UPI0035E13464